MKTKPRYFCSVELEENALKVVTKKDEFSVTKPPRGIRGITGKILYAFSETKELRDKLIIEMLELFSNKIMEEIKEESFALSKKTIALDSINKEISIRKRGTIEIFYKKKR